ncbi:MAG: FRG domain-containing protein [Aeromonas sobria]|uniref:FRG domain-containing protein n=1 Tax=Aeromonas sobria TaxID=646 RepID=UPI003F382A4C
MTIKHRKPHNRLPIWPNFDVIGDEIDGGIPVTKVRNWQSLQEVFSNDPIFKTQDEWLFRGQRRSDWGLTPSLARLSANETIDRTLAERQLNQFKYSIRGRVNSISTKEDVDVWAIGQHFGLMTPLLDWSRSPYVAMFFAFEMRDPDNESPKNYSRSIFALNKTKLNDLDIDVFVDTLSSDHDRLISQNGLFTISPFGESNTLETFILSRLSEQEIDIDNPETLKEYIFKVHIPMEDESDRLNCFQSLRKMNIHHSSLYPDLIGSSSHCNELIREKYIAKLVEHN